jgi:murein DD-endopeptidase MepM/ murein hydrolase activator NlpD
LSSRSYQGRHRGRHRAPQTKRLPRALHPGLALPTAAAAALVVTATGASMAQSAPLTLDLSQAQAESARTQAADAVAAQADLTQRRQQVALQVAAVEGRVAEEGRIARSRARIAAEAKATADAEAAARAKALREGKRWVKPIANAPLTSGFGMRWGRLHAGLDFGAPVGTPLVAMSKGVVTYAGGMSGYGNIVKIKYWDGTESYFGHMNTITAQVGQEVLPGEQVGTSGNTGHSTGPHLHLEIHPNGGGPIDPRPWLAAHGLI